MPGAIGDYALIGDMETAALVGRDGSIDWLCLPRFDSQACFAALLGDESHGRWRIAPAAGGSPTHVAADVDVRRRYRGDTLILETEWQTGDGTVRVIDFMSPRDQVPDLLRIVEGVSGAVQMASELKPRLDYGQVVPWLYQAESQVGAIAGPDSFWLSSPVGTHSQDFTTYADFTVTEGQRLPFVLTWNPSHGETPAPADPEAALARTEKVWREWISDCAYQGKWRDPIVRSLLTLKALTYGPTGGVVTSPTASLPAQPGVSRNADYRYCWTRDAAVTLDTLLRSGCTESAQAWRRWLGRAVAGTPAGLQSMYGLAGERRLPEYSLDWLPGHDGAGPVRVGNAATSRFKLDVYGEVLSAMHIALRAGIPPRDETWALLRELADFLARNWREPDSGLWDTHEPRRHFVYSKVMAWVGLDRAARIADMRGTDEPVDYWRAERDEIHREVCERGYDSDRGTFTRYYGSGTLDASLLLLPRLGFLPVGDERVVGTVNAIERELVVDGLVRRYESENGGEDVPASDGAFLACSFWLAEALHLLGRRADAQNLFERLLSLRNDVGLLSEMYDPRHERLVGNMPLALSHVALAHAAYTLAGWKDAH